MNASLIISSCWTWSVPALSLILSALRCIHFIIRIFIIILILLLLQKHLLFNLLLMKLLCRSEIEIVNNICYISYSICVCGLTNLFTMRIRLGILLSSIMRFYPFFIWSKLFSIVWNLVLVKTCLNIFLGFHIWSISNWLFISFLILFVLFFILKTLKIFCSELFICILLCNPWVNQWFLDIDLFIMS